jgi:hypothetical protein
MTRSIGRRAVLVGAAAVVATIGIGATPVHPTAPAPAQAANAAEAAYAKLLADVHADYVNGRVVEHNGWVLSQHEFDTIGSRQQAQKAAG